MRDVKEHLRQMTAHHEAAHGVILYRVSGSAGAVSVIPSADTLGEATDPGIIDSTVAEDLRAHILSLYAGGHAQRVVDPSCGGDGCEKDDEDAAEWLERIGWTDREMALREESLALVRQHWAEIEAVARELLEWGLLDGTEVELIADAAAGDHGADVAEYRRNFGDHLDRWRQTAQRSR